MSRQKVVSLISETLQWSAKSRSKDGMTGISDHRALGLALDVHSSLNQHGFLVADKDGLNEVRRLAARAKGSLAKNKSRPTHREDAIRDLEAALEILNELIGEA